MINKQHMANWNTSLGERVSYGSYLFGQNLFYNIVTMFLATYLLMQGVTPQMTAGALLIVKAWDAVNDILFGGIVDMVKFKKDGKFIPWLKVSVIVIPLATIILFAIPQSFNPSMKVLWFTIAYILWDCAYTISDVPIYGLVTTITDVQSERTSIMILGRFFALIGSSAVVFFGTLLTSEVFGVSFTATAFWTSIIGALFFLPICIKGNERVKLKNETKEDKYSFGKMFKYLGKNKYLQIYYISFIVSGGLNVGGMLTQFVAFYLFDSAFLATIMLVASSFSIIIILLLPLILKKIDKFKLLIWAMFLSGILGVVTWLVGYDNFTVYLALTILRSFPVAVCSMLAFMFTPDCAEYGQYVSSIDAKGITFALQTFSAKMVAAISSFLGIALLGFFGWQTVVASSFAELQTMGITQSQIAFEGLWFVSTLVPAIGGLLSGGVLMFYKLNDKDVSIMAKCNSGEISRNEAECLLSRKYT